MKKQKRDTSEICSLDSLLDTLTSVVGVLIIVMAMLQVAGHGSYEETSTELPNYTYQDIETKREELLKLKGLLSSLKDRWAVLKGEIPEWIDMQSSLSLRIEEIEHNIPDANELIEKTDSARAKKEELLQAKVELLRQIDVAKKNINEKQTVIETSQVPKQIRLPEVKQTNRNMETVEVMVRHGHIYCIDTKGLSAELEKRLTSAAATIPSSARNSLYGLSKYFAQKLNTPKICSEFICLQVEAFSRGLIIQIIPRSQKQGESLAALEEVDVGQEETIEACEFAQMIRTIDPDSTVVQFYVWSDSFELYLQARELAERLHLSPEDNRTKLLCGWTAYDLDENMKVVVDFTNLDANGNATGVKYD